MPRHLLALFAAMVAGCATASSVEVTSTPPERVSTSFARLPLVLEGIPKTGDLALHEGLPSEFWEPELLAQERSRKPTVEIRGYPFYEDPLVLERADAEQLTAVLSAKKSFKPYRDQKACGGYHPDYCLAWGTGESATRALICLECAEVKIFAPRSELHCDINRESAETLVRLLRPYRKNRPGAGAGSN